MIMRRDLLLLAILSTALASPALGQTTQPSAAAGAKSPPGAAEMFTGIWWHPSLPWFEPMSSGPKPVTNRVRNRAGVSEYAQLVGDYTNPILQPWAAEVVKKFGEMSLAGITYGNPSNQCWPEPPPFIYKQALVLILQKPDTIKMV